jgi:hypothetical protein
MGSLVNSYGLRIGLDYPGAIDEVEIYNRVLTPTEVLNIYKAG